MENNFQDVQVPSASGSGTNNQPTASVGFGQVIPTSVNDTPAQPVTPATPAPAPAIPPATTPTTQPGFTQTPVTPPSTIPPVPKKPFIHINWKKIGLIAGIALLAALILGGAAWVFMNVLNRQEEPQIAANRFNNVQIPLSELVSEEGLALLGTRSLNINGPLRANDAFIISPSGQPSNATPGQLYYDQVENFLAYYNGSQFVEVGGDGVQSIGGQTGIFTLGGGLTASGGQITNTGVLSLQGQTGNVTLVAGPGVSIDGTALTNTGVTSFGGQSGDIAVGNGLGMSGNTLQNTGIISAASGSASITVTNDGSGNITISSTGAGSGTVQSPNGTPGRIAKFTGLQTIEDSLISESGTTITVNGNLSVTGALSLSTALTVGNGGTGTTSLANNGVVIGQGAGALTAVTAGAPGLCLVSTAGAPEFASCTGSTGVTALNSLTGSLTLANATGAGSTITINDASTAQKGIAQFNATNFTAAGGTINTIQNINSGATPTFAGVNTNSINPSGALTVGSTGQAFTLQGNASSVINATSGVNSTTLSFQAPTAAVTYRFATAAAGIYDVCTTVGNCAGTGGGVTTAGGTAGRIAKFTGAQTLADSLLSETGSTVTVSGNLNITTGSQFQINGTQISSAALSNDANLAKLNATQTFTGGTNTFQNSSNSVTAFSIQNAASNRLLTADTTNGEVELGQSSTLGGRLVFNNASNTNTITLLSATATGNRTITLPDETGTVCLSTGNCAGAGVTLQSAYNNSTSPEITVDATRGALTIRDAATPIGANLLEVQNNAGSTTFFAVTSSGTSTTGTSTTSGNINSTGGGLQTNSTTRVDNSGNLTNIGSISLNGSISGGTTYSGSGNINTSGGALQTAGTTRVDNTGNLVNIGNITGTGAITIASSGAGNDITIDGSDQFIVQDAATFNALATFNTDIDLAFADSENLSITSTVTGTTSVNLLGAVLTNNTSSGTQQVALLQNASGSGATEGLLVLDNADTDTAVANGLHITSAGGGITTAIEVSDPDIVTALLFGANDITGTNFSVTGGSGSITSAGNATLQGGTVTVGTAAQAGELVLHDGSSNTGTLEVAALGQNTTYILPDPGAGTATICLTTGNCAGTGGGVTGSGTNNRLAKFTATGSTIGDSTLSDDGTNVTTSVDVIVQGGDLTVGTSSQLASFVLHDGNGQSTTLQAGDSVGDLTFILPTTAGSANQCLKQSGTGNQLIWDTCDGGGGGSSATLQGAYNNGNTITTTDARNIAVTLADTTTDSNFTVSVADGSTSFVSLSRANGTGTADPAQLLLLDNLDTDRAVPVGLKLQAAGGGLTTAIDASDADIIDAISVGANNIVGTTGNIDLTNFDVVGATGNITTAGDLAVNGGDITSTGALTIATSGTGDLILDSADTIELADNTNVTGNVDISGTLTSGSGNAFQVDASGNITSTGNATLQGGAITAGTTTQGGSVVLYDGSSNTGTIQTTALSSDRTYTLPDESGTVCLSTGNCAGAGVTLQSAYNNSTSPEITLDATRGALTIRDNATPIGVNLLEVQDNSGSTTFFGVTSSGVSVAGTATVSGNINSTGGALQTNGTSRVDNSGNLVNIGNITGSGAITVASTGAGNDIIINGADILDVQDAAVFSDTTTFNGTATFNTNVDIALADTENVEISSTATGTNSVDVLSVTLTNNTSSGTQRGAVIQNAAGSGTTESLLTLDNADTDTAVTTGLQITAAAGGIQTAIDLSDPEIATALSVGANDITGTTANIDFSNFDVDGSGNIITAGDAAVNGGDITSTGALNITPGGTLTVGAAAQTLTLQGGASTSLSAVSGANTTSLIFETPTANVNYRLPTATAGTYDICTTASVCTGYAPESGSGNYIQNGTSQQIANFYVTSAAAGSIAARIEGAANQSAAVLLVKGGTNPTADVLEVQNSSGNQIFAVNAASTRVIVGGNTLCTTGRLCVGQTTTSSGGTINNLYNIQSVNVAGSTNIHGHDIIINDTSTAVANTINGFTINTSGTTNTSATINSIRAFIPSGATGTFLQFQNGSTNALHVANSGEATFRTITDSTTGFEFLNASGNAVANIDTSNGELELGTASTLGGKLVFHNATNANTITLVPATASASRTITLPDETGTVCLQSSSNCGFLAGSSSDYIQNQNSAQQTSSNFWISGTGRADTALQAPLLDTATATALNVGTTNATAINLNQNTTVTASTTGDALTVSNSTSSGNILVLQDNATTVLTVADGGSATFQNGTDIQTAFRVLTAGGSSVFNVDTQNQRVGVGGTASFSKFEVLGGDAAIYNSGNNPRLILGDSTVGGENGYLQWDSTNNYFRIESVGTNGLKINDNYVSIGNIFPDQPLKIGNGSTLLAQVNTTGQALFQNSTDSTTAFRVLSQGSASVFNVDTDNERVGIGTSAPGAQLDVAGQVPAAATGTATAIDNVYDVVVQGKYAYAGLHGDLQIFDITRPSAPASVGSVALVSGQYDIIVSGTHAFMWNSLNDNLSIVDVSNPATPTSVESMSITDISDVAIQGRYMYVSTSDSSSNIFVYDISDPANPVLKSTQSQARDTGSMVIQDGYMYALQNNGLTSYLQVIDISNPTSFSNKDDITLPAFGFDLAIRGRYVFVAGGDQLMAVDVSNVNTLASASNFTLSGSSAQHVKLQGRYAYVSQGTSNTVQVVNITNPASMSSVGNVSVGGEADGIDVVGRYLYVSDATNATVDIYDMGGTYTQQLEAGSVDAANVQVNDTLKVSGKADVGAGLRVNGGAAISGDLGLAGTQTIRTTTNSNSAFRILNSDGHQLFNISSIHNPNDLSTNGSIESNTTGWSAKGSASISRTTAQKYVGEASLQTVTTAAIGDGAKYTIQLSPSTQYTASIYAKLSSGTFTNMSVGYSSDGTTETDCKTGEQIKTTGWLNINCTFTTAATVNASAYFYWEQAGATARTVFVDAFQIVAGSDIGAFYTGKIDSGGLIFSGPVAIQNDNDSNSPFQVQSSNGTTVFGTDAVNFRVGVNMIAPTAALDVTTIGTTSVTAEFNQSGSSTQDILRLQKSNDNTLTVSHSGATTLQNLTDSTAAFRILGFNATFGSGTPVFQVDTTNSRVHIGNPTADSTGALLVLDTKNTSGDPTGVAGGTYYNSNTGKFRCYENGAWKDCLGFNASITLFALNGNGNASTWTNQPAALTEFMVGVSGVANPANRVKYDFSNAQQVRLILNCEQGGATNAEIRIQYSTDGSTWNYLDAANTGMGVNIDLPVVSEGSWTNIATGAKDDVWIRLVGIDGDAVNDPEFGLIQLQAR